MNTVQKILTVLLIVALFGSLHGIYLYTESLGSNNRERTTGPSLFQTIDADPVPLPNRRDLPRTSFQLQELSEQQQRQVRLQLAVDLNEASADQLTTLHRVGQATANNIVQHRQQHGPFSSLEELTEVSGIGPATIEHWRGHVRIGNRLIE